MARSKPVGGQISGEGKKGLKTVKKVLVIDDEPFILMIIEDKLKKAGYKVITKRTSNDIVELVKSDRPDILILDWILPGKSGIDICNELKKNPETGSIPIFMLTAKGHEADEALGFKCGVEQYITKPFSPKALLNLIENTIGKP